MFLLTKPERPEDRPGWMTEVILYLIAFWQSKALLTLIGLALIMLAFRMALVLEVTIDNVIFLVTKDFSEGGYVMATLLAVGLTSLAGFMGAIYLARGIGPWANGLFKSTPRAFSASRRLESGQSVLMSELTRQERDALKGQRVLITSGVSPTPMTITGVAQGMYAPESHTFVVSNVAGDIDAFSGGHGERYVYESDEATIRLV